MAAAHAPRSKGVGRPDHHRRRRQHGPVRALDSERVPGREDSLVRAKQEPFRQLEEWAASQGSERVAVFNTALGDHQGTIEMSGNREHSPSASILAATPRSAELFPQTVPQCREAVEITTLDSALAPMMPELEPAILVKLDVQGYEDRVLRGAGEVLRRATACVLEVLVEPLYDGQPRFEELVALLCDAGYSYAGNLNQVHAGDGRVVFLDAVFVRRDGSQGWR